MATRLLFVLWCLVAWRSTPAQRVSVVGTAYDSLRGAPIVDARVAMLGTGMSSTTDSAGRFRFDGVAPGGYAITMQHAAFDSVGLTGVSRRVVVSAVSDTVRLFLPSFLSLWRAACGDTPVSDTAALVYGNVRDAAGRPAVDATVDATWVDAGFDKATGITQHRYRLEARSDSTGGYSLCGLPSQGGVQIHALKNTIETGVVDALPREPRIRRLDLLLGDAGASSLKGTVVGGIVAEGGAPVAGARVIVDESSETRSDKSGAFVVRGVAPGTRQIEVHALGMSPALTTVDVAGGDTARIAVELHRVVSLDSVRVVAPLSVRQRRVANIEERRKQGFGYFRDSTEVAKYPTIAAVLNSVPGTTARGTPARTMVAFQGCTANIFLDGVHVKGQIQLTDLYPEQIATIEVYPRAVSAPAEFVVPSGPGAGCGVVVVWTKRAMP
ncbi:MAG: carboxypeptidase-like regulatory domain-containing protein [Gemmatimonadaceae bacterium]